MSRYIQGKELLTFQQFYYIIEETNNFEHGGNNMPTGKPTKKKPCAICGEMFLPDKPSNRICKKDHISECPICHSPMVWNSTRAAEPCSKDCRLQLTKLKSMKKYGCEHPMQNKEVQANHRKAMLEKYGVESPLQSDEIKKRAIQSNRDKFGTDWALSSTDVHVKIKGTMLERYGAPTTYESEYLNQKVMDTMINKYGVDNPSKSVPLQQKKAQTNIERYGSTNPMKNSQVAKKMSESRQQHSQEIMRKCREHWKDTLGVDNPSKSPEVIEKIQCSIFDKYGYKNAMQVPEIKEKVITTNLERYGVPYTCMTDKCRQANGNVISQTNKRVCSKLTGIGLSFTLEKSIGRKSYDICIEDQKVLLEVDPTYTHNYVGNHWNKKGLPISYHLEKSKVASDSGYRCIHVFDWDDQDKLVNMLQTTKPMYARKMTLYRLHVDVAKKFLNEFHLQGSCRGQLLCLGLVQDGELYEVMTFGKPRYDKKYSVELLRLCTRPGYRVIGGASKLFRYATSEYGLSNIISYCDLSKFNGNVYEKIGMTLVRRTPPQEIWSKGTKKITANLLRQRGYDQLFGTSYGKGTSNEHLMLDNGWLPIYDCGQAVYEHK